MAIILSTSVYANAGVASVQLSDGTSFSCSDLKSSSACPADAPKCTVDLRNRGLTKVPDLGELDCADDIRVLYALLGLVRTWHCRMLSYSDLIALTLHIRSQCFFAVGGLGVTRSRSCCQTCSASSRSYECCAGFFRLEWCATNEEEEAENEKSSDSEVDSDMEEENMDEIKA